MDFIGEETEQVQILQEKCFLDSGGRNDLAGHTSERPCNLMYSVYGSNLSVTKIIAKLIDDKREGTSKA